MFSETIAIGLPIFPSLEAFSQPSSIRRCHPSAQETSLSCYLYRPISNLNNIFKIIERLFLSQFYPHVTSSNFNHFQSAYRPHHSTETAILQTFDDIFCASLIAVNQLFLSPWILALLLMPSTISRAFHDIRL